VYDAAYAAYKLGSYYFAGDMDSRKVGFARYLLVSSLAQSLLLSFHHTRQSLCRSQSSFEVAEKSDREQTLAV
jgi:hypothetical protein